MWIWLLKILFIFICLLVIYDIIYITILIRLANKIHVCVRYSRNVFLNDFVPTKLPTFPFCPLLHHIRVEIWTVIKLKKRIFLHAWRNFIATVRHYSRLLESWCDKCVVINTHKHILSLILSLRNKYNNEDNERFSSITQPTILYHSIGIIIIKFLYLRIDGEGGH